MTLQHGAHRLRGFLVVSEVALEERRGVAETGGLADRHPGVHTEPPGGVAGGLDDAEQLELRIAEQDFSGKKMMVILCDRYGNEKSLVFEKKDFTPVGRSAKKAAKKGRTGR